jgi:hypothetical protein
MKYVRVAVVVAALVPSAILAWLYRDMPQFGEGHDDAILFGSAKSLADGNGYRIASLPSAPFQTKYPPLYPALLSVVWRVYPDFPGNLANVMLLAWLPLPFLAAATYLFFERVRAPALLAAVVVLNPYTLLFALSLRTELLFSTLLIAALLAMDRRPAVAGALAGIAYMTRTAGIALAISCVAVLLWRREYRKASGFSLAMAPFVVAWTMWVHEHRTVSSDPNLLYYLDYVRFGLTNQSWNNIHQFVFLNAWGIVEGIGGLFLVDTDTFALVRAVLVIVAAAAVIGIGRSARNRDLQPYLAFAAVYVAILLLWHFPPGERFLYPILPLLVYGAFVEFSRLAGALRTSPQRGAAVVMGTALASLVLWIAWTQTKFVVRTMPENLAAHRAADMVDREAFAWIRKNVPHDATFMTSNDPVLYLHTGRRAMNLITPTRYYYEGRRDRMLDVQYGAIDFATRNNLQYIYLDKRFRYVFTEEEHKQILKRTLEDPRVELVYESGPISILKRSPGHDVANGIVSVTPALP